MLFLLLLLLCFDFFPFRTWGGGGGGGDVGLYSSHSMLGTTYSREVYAIYLVIKSPVFGQILQGPVRSVRLKRGVHLKVS